MYSTEEILKKIKEWDLTQSHVSELLDYVQQFWTYPDRFIREKHSLYLSTGGWSGNEDIVSALQDNYLFWTMYWYRSQRGGHYWFNDKIVANELKGFTRNKGLPLSKRA
jgi:hypothetical protein